MPVRALDTNGYVELLRGGPRLAAMTRAGHDPAELQRRAFFLDVHVAHLCRTRGVVLWTDDADHERIRPHVGHAVELLPR